MDPELFLLIIFLTVVALCGYAIKKEWELEKEKERLRYRKEQEK